MNAMSGAIAAAQEYDLAHRPAGQVWARVPDEQVARLLAGAAPLIVNAVSGWSMAAVAESTLAGGVPEDRIERIHRDRPAYAEELDGNEISGRAQPAT